MVKILITGSNSYVGKNFIRNSIYSDCDEVSLLNNNPKNIDFEKYDTVLHIAAIVHQSKTIPEEEYFRVNRDLCIEVAKFAKESGVHQFVFLSTVKVYGEFNPDSGPWTETSECHPDDPYGRSKYEAEIELRKMEDDGFAVSVIRTPLVYGQEVKANMLSIMRLVDKMCILPFKNVNNKRSFTYAKNLIGFIDRIIEKRASGVFIAMDSDPLSTTQLVQFIARYLNKKVILISIPKPLISLGKRLVPKIFDRLYGSFEMENSVTLQSLDFTPQYSSEEGIREMCLAYMQKKIKIKNLSEEKC
jgi:UDP-glucose 4-epimerase